MSNSRTVVITGGGSGIGLASARLFLERGDQVALTGRNEEKLQRAVDSLNAGDKAMAHPTDISDPEQVANLVKTVLDKWGSIDVLLNNAGLNIKERTLAEMTNESWQKIVRTNLDGAFYCVQAVLPSMRERQQGLIININSISGKRAGPLGGIAYAAAKHGMHGMAICAGAEEKENNIRVCSIYPGEVDTPILEDRPNPVTDDHRQRILQPEDVAQAVLFIANLPPRATVPELVIAPTTQMYI